MLQFFRNFIDHRLQYRAFFLFPDCFDWLNYRRNKHIRYKKCVQSFWEFTLMTKYQTLTKDEWNRWPQWRVLFPSFDDNKILTSQKYMPLIGILKLVTFSSYLFRPRHTKCYFNWYASSTLYHTVCVSATFWSFSHSNRNWCILIRKLLRCIINSNRLHRLEIRISEFLV